MEQIVKQRMWTLSFRVKTGTSSQNDMGGARPAAWPHVTLRLPVLERFGGHGPAVDMRATDPTFWDAQLSVTVAGVRRERGECGTMHSVRGTSDGKREG